MAGLGRRTFAPGEVLTATNVMGYLQDQAVMKFAGTAARGSAIGTAVAEGMVSYLADTNLVEVYDGSAWKQISATSGNILQVVSATYSTVVAVSSTTPQNTGLTATITPKSASSKIFVIASQQQRAAKTGNDAGLGLYLIRAIGASDTTLISDPGRIESLYTYAAGATTIEVINRAPINYLDSPNTTSAVTYRVQGASAAAGHNLIFQYNNSMSTITLLEVAG